MGYYLASLSIALLPSHLSHRLVTYSRQARLLILALFAAIKEIVQVFKQKTKVCQPLILNYNILEYSAVHGTLPKRRAVLFSLSSQLNF